jgi:hypothetical protein
MAWNNTSRFSKVTDIEQVHLIFMSHLDVGFTGLITEVLSLYPSTFYPRSLALSAAMRAVPNSTDRFIYTTHPWLLSLFFHCPELVLSGQQLACPSEAEQQAVRAAIAAGDIAFHAAPYNVEWEVAFNAEMVAGFFSLAKGLAEELGMPAPTVASVRDVPGFTRALIPLLVQNNITAISEGVNPETLPPQLASPAVWRDEASNSSVLYMQHSWGYGASARGSRQVGDSNCAVVIGHSHALCFLFRGEGTGPPDNVGQVQAAFASLRAEFPNASVFASTFENYVQSLAAIQDILPVVTSESGETWINGVAAHPAKLTLYREGAAAYAACLHSGDCDPADPRIKDFLRFFIKVSWQSPAQLACAVQRSSPLPPSNLPLSPSLSLPCCLLLRRPQSTPGAFPLSATPLTGAMQPSMQRAPQTQTSSDMRTPGWSS